MFGGGALSLNALVDPDTRNPNPDNRAGDSDTCRGR